jgi:carbonic anhydrase/acetyltransferase-like protein (isoleucine patch superfamily)
MMAGMQSIGDFYVASDAVVIGDVILSPGVNLWYGVIVRGDLARIKLGQGVNLQDGVIVHTDRDAPQDIERGVVVGHGAILHGRRIGADTLVGMGATLLSGSDVGPECVVAAGTLVPENRRIPPRSVVMGVPAKIIREVTSDDLERTWRINGHYQELARKHAAGAFQSPWKKS